MKKVIIAAIMLVISNAGFSQIKKGQWLVGGSAGFETGKFGSSDASKYTSFSFSPNAGYFFINNFAGGLRVALETTKVKDVDAVSSFLAAPFVRYYFLPAAEKVNILADASYGFGSLKDNGSSKSLNQFTVAAGPAVFLSPNTALEFLLQYRSKGGDAFGGNDRWNSFGLNVGFQIHLGK
jgi:hypothetical protein